MSSEPNPSLSKRTASVPLYRRFFRVFHRQKRSASPPPLLATSSSPPAISISPFPSPGQASVSGLPAGHSPSRWRGRQTMESQQEPLSPPEALPLTHTRTLRSPAAQSQVCDSPASGGGVAAGPSELHSRVTSLSAGECGPSGLSSSRSTGPAGDGSPSRDLSGRFRQSFGERSTSNLSSSAAQPAESFVFAWGSNLEGQAFSADGNCIRRPRRVERLSNQMIASIYCGPESSWVVSASGTIWGGGNNSQGLVSPAAMEDEPRVTYPKHVEEFEAVSVRAVGSGADQTVMVLDSGAAMSFGVNNEFGQLGHGPGTEKLTRVSPRKMIGVTVPISFVACGGLHTLALSTTGQVFSCGNGSDGCLGMKDSLHTSSALLKAVPNLVGVPVQQIAAATRHCMALSLGGGVFAWGRNKKGRLGLPSVDDPIVAIPTLISEPDLPPCKRLATSDNHSALIAQRGRLYMCGDNAHGQLGVDPDGELSRDRFKEVMIGVKVRLASCGSSHTALITNQGDLMTFGLNNCGQIGRNSGDADFCWKPETVTFETVSRQESPLSSSLPRSIDSSKLFFYALAAGANHTVSVAIRVPHPISHSNATSTGSSRYDLTSAAAATALPSLLHRSLTHLGSSKSPLQRLDSALRVGGHHLERLPSVHLNTPTMLRSLPSIVLKAGTGPCLLCPALSRLGSDGMPEGGSAAGSERTVDSSIPIEYGDNELPAGCSVLEALCLAESARSTARMLGLKKRFSTVFSDANRLNCSFLLPSRSSLLDVEGLDSVYKEVLRLPEAFRGELTTEMLQAVGRCLDSIEDYAHLLRSEEQVRFLAVILQSPICDSATAASIRVLTKLVKIVFLCPPEGRRALAQIFRRDYPADVFGDRLVFHVRSFLDKQISLHGQHCETVVSIWHGVALLQMLFVASADWVEDQKRQVKTEVESRAAESGKIPMDHFTLTSLESADPRRELKVLSDVQRALRQEDGPRAENSSVPREGLVSVMFRAGDRSAPESGTSAEGDSGPASGEGEAATSGPTKRSAAANRSVTPKWRFNPRSIYDVRTLEPSWTFFFAHSNLCPLRFKRNVIMAEAASVQQELGLRSLMTQSIPFFVLPVRRSNLLEDALNMIGMIPPSVMRKPLKIVFDGEEGVDEGGLKKEFFSILVRTLFNPNFGMFVYNEEARTVWFNRLSVDSEKEFLLIGVLLGLALYNDNLLELQFPLAIYKKLQSESVGLEDLCEVFPDEAKSFHRLLDWPADDEENFNAAFEGMTFELQYDFFGEMRTVELARDGKNKQLTYSNRQEYVESYVNYLLNESIADKFKAFSYGFGTFQTELSGSVSGRELQLLICGSPDFNFDDLRASVDYEGYSSTEPYIESFWRIVSQFNVEHKKKFLQFCTGTDRVPLGGLSELKLKIQKNGVEPTDRLPTAYTCFNCLLLPHYDNVAKLERLLVLAVEQSQGFGLK